MKPATVAAVRTLPATAADRAILRASKLAQERDALSQQIKSLEAEKRELDTLLFSLVEKVGTDDKLDLDRFSVSIVRQKISTLDRQALLDLGVKPTIVAKATITKDKAPFVSVRSKKGEGE